MRRVFSHIRAELPRLAIASLLVAVGLAAAALGLPHGWSGLLVMFGVASFARVGDRLLVRLGLWDRDD